MDSKKVVIKNDKEKNDKLDCFAWISTNECNALIKKECEKCSFYKPKSKVPNYKKYLTIDTVN